MKEWKPVPARCVPMRRGKIYEMSGNKCQIQCVQKMADAVGTGERIWQLRNRLKRIFKRRLNYLMNWLSELKKTAGNPSTMLREKEKENLLQPGDLVRVRTKREIQSTLDRWNQLKKCSFMEEMWPYCGTTQRVFKQIKKFLDERDYLLKKCNGIVILEGVFCEGTKDFGPCDRSCFFFWREEWLEKIDNKEN